VENDNEAVVEENDNEAVVEENDNEEVVENDNEEVVENDNEEVVENDNEEVVEGSSEEELEINVYEKNLKPPSGNGRKTYYISDDDSKEIYEKLEDGSIGDCIGKLTGKTNRPHFFNK
jgi:hypothetical protein